MKPGGASGKSSARHTGCATAGPGNTGGPPQKLRRCGTILSAPGLSKIDGGLRAGENLLGPGAGPPIPNLEKSFSRL